MAFVALTQSQMQCRPVDAARGTANPKGAGPAAMKIAALNLGQSPSILGGGCRRALSSVVDLVVPPLTNGPLLQH